MAVELTATDASFIGTGISSVYATQFYANNANQVRVYVAGVLKTLGDDYTLAGLNSSSGVAVTGIFTGGAAVYVERITPIKQEVDTQNNETILEDVLDGEFDLLTMIDQEQQTQIDRSTRTPKGETGIVLPPLAQRAGYLARFDVDGDLVGLTGVSQQLVAVDALGRPYGLSIFNVLSSIGLTIYDDGTWGGAVSANDGVWG